MKKKPSISVVLLIFLLSACGNSTSQSDVISPAELTEREDAIISTISDESFVFDYKIEAEYEEVSMWMEKYESGKLVDDKINEMTTQVAKESGTIILAKSKANEGETKQNYYIGVSDENGLTSMVAAEEKLDNTEYSSGVSG